MKRIFFFLFLLMLFFSCTTVKWKKNYITKHIEQYYRDFGIKADSFEFRTTGEEKFSLKPIEKMTRRDVKNDVEIWKKIYAVIPDSISTSNAGIDSFYFNKNKIEFIRKNDLQSTGMHFME